MKTEVLVDLGLVDCPVCGIRFWVDETFKQHRQQDHETMYCPNGHSLYFPSETEEERLRKLVLVKTRRVNELEEKQGKRDKELKQLHKRISAGVCPHCHRHFTNLERHMKTKHTCCAVPD
jgi:NAD-dependent SIR2 family protein deacetylase